MCVGTAKVHHGHNGPRLYINFIYWRGELIRIKTKKKLSLKYLKITKIAKMLLGTYLCKKISIYAFQ